MYKELQDIFPYLISIRKLENYVSLDIQFPTQWKLPKKYVDPEKTLEQTSKDSNFRAFSFAVSFEEPQIKKIFENVKGIISWNIEREMKEELLQKKVNELKMFFEKNSLDSLKSLQFNLQKELNKIEFEDDETKDIELVRSGDSEGQD